MVHPGGWYVFVVVLSLGMLSFVPFLHAATRVRKPLMWLWVVLYTAAVVMLFVLVDDDAEVGGLAAALMIIASVHSVVLRKRVWSSIHPAVAAVLTARARRDEARRIAADDPQMARELRIGRPDLSRTYDDGGLVDLNSAPAHVIAEVCEIEPAVAERITESRAFGIVFTTVDDVFSVTDIPYPLWDRIRERSVVITA